jgi:prepilin-type N-terminal cleavage/methylation domain-containing protein
MDRHSIKGFTLVELLIVVFTLGILVTMAIPEFKGYSTKTRKSSLHSNLNILRTSIECYFLQHDGFYPGNLLAVKDWDTFVKQMTEPTNRIGDVGTRYGPYIKNDIPRNPYNNLNTGKTGAFGGGPDGTTGWWYNPDTGEIRPNHTGAPWGVQQEITQQDIIKPAK